VIFALACSLPLLAAQAGTERSPDALFTEMDRWAAFLRATDFFLGAPPGLHDEVEAALQPLLR
jgi:hypothetical protein